MAVLGKLKIWLDAYSVFVHQATQFLFGWLHLAWIGISSDEMHVLVLAAILCSAFARAEYAFNATKGIPDALFNAVFLALASFAIIFLPALLLPGILGVYGALIALVVVAFFLLVVPGTNAAHPSTVWKEIVGVVAVFLVLVVLNYSIFRTDGG